MQDSIATPFSSSPFGVLWDLDGTLVDTMEFHRQSWSLALPEFGYPFPAEKFHRSFGMNNTGVLEVFLGWRPERELAEAIGERKEVLFRELLRGHVRTLPGVREWLERLAGWGARQAVATSAPPENIALMMGELDILPYFETVVSGYELPSKPDPAVFLKAAAIVGVPPQACVVMEDAVAGVQAAKRGGMRCIAVTTTNPAAALDAADIVVDRLNNLDEGTFRSLMGFDDTR